MNGFEWSPEDVHRLNNVVLQAVADGIGRAEAFKQFARDNGIKSVNAVRYKWISSQLAPSTDEHGLFKSQGIHGDVRNRAVPRDTAKVLKENSCLKLENKKLESTVVKLASTIETLKEKNRQLRQENKKLVDSLQTAVGQQQPVVLLLSSEKHSLEKVNRLMERLTDAHVVLEETNARISR